MKLRHLDPAEIAQLEALRDDMMALARTRLGSGDVTAEGILAVFAMMTGAALALQDQQTMTVDEGFALITANIQQGNETMIAELFRGATSV